MLVDDFATVDEDRRTDVDSLESESNPKMDTGATPGRDSLTV